jgi:threonine synthase
VEVLAVYIAFKARVEAKLKMFKDPHCPRRSPVRFTQAIPYEFKGTFPVMYVVDKEIVEDADLFGSHTVVTPATANAVRALMRKRKRVESDSEDD